MSSIKGLAVSQIIMLVLGILVLAVVAFLLYSNFVSTGTTVSAEQCRAAATRACTGCSIAGTTDSCGTSFLDAAGKKCFEENNIALSDVDKIACRQYIGSGGSSIGTVSDQSDSSEDSNILNPDKSQDSIRGE